MKRSALVLAASILAMGLSGCGKAKVTVSDAAVEALDQISYTDEATTGVSGNFDLSATSSAENYEFTVTYTAGALVEYPSGYNFISISEDGKTAIVKAPNYLDKTLDFKAKYGSFAQCYIEATINYEGTAVKDPSDETKNLSKRYNIRINATSSCKVADLYTTDLFKAGIAVELDAYYMCQYDPTAGDNTYKGVFVADGDAALELYGLNSLPDGIKEGDPIHITGKTSPYNGLMELAKPLSVTLLTEAEATASGIVKPVTIQYTDATVIEHKNICSQIHVTGTVAANPTTEVASGRTTSDIKVTVGTKTLAVRVDSKYMGDDLAAKAVAKFVKGATVDFTGILGYYSSADEFDAKKIQVLRPVFAD